MGMMEPYRIKSVEPLPLPTRQEREAALRLAGYNLFRLPANEVTIDLLTDSGTGSLSNAQWSALLQGDESYAGSTSWQRFRDVVAELVGYQHIMPVHQGRAAERILFTSALRTGDIVISNSHFDTTRANIGLAGGQAIDIPTPFSDELDGSYPFKGDIDLAKLEKLLISHKSDVAMVLMTVTNNTLGGQPVSMANLREVRRLCDEHRVLFMLDACRFAENAYLITQREPEFRGAEVREVAKEMFRLADGATMSLKKDGMVNIGGFLALNDDLLAARCGELLIATEGFLTYGGLAGRDLEAAAVGLTEVTENAYLASRHEDAMHLAEVAEEAGVATVRPTGCHAVYLDAGRFLPHVPSHEFPGHALAVELYREGGIRSCEMGSLVFGSAASADQDDPLVAHELLRLAIPRRVYTWRHLDHVGACLKAIAARKHDIPGYRIVSGTGPLRHFTAELAPVHQFPRRLRSVPNPRPEQGEPIHPSKFKPANQRTTRFPRYSNP